MLLLFCWRLSFEFFELAKFLGLRGPVKRYFAFGGNMDPRVLKNRGMNILKEEYHRLENTMISFDQAGPFIGSGFASIKEQSGSHVFGKIYDIYLIDKLRMHCFEAAWVLQKYNVIEENGLFYYQSSRPKEGLLPTKDYQTKILAGYQQAPKECAEFVKLIENWPVLEKNEPASEINLVIHDYGQGPLRNVLMAYDRFVFKLRHAVVAKQAPCHCNIRGVWHGIAKILQCPVAATHIDELIHINMDDPFRCSDDILFQRFVQRMLLRRVALPNVIVAVLNNALGLQLVQNFPCAVFAVIRVDQKLVDAD